MLTVFVLPCRVADQIRTWLQLGRQRDPEAWEMFASTVNAYYNPPANEVRSCSLCQSPCLCLTPVSQIVFPAGILRPPYFHADW